MCNSNLLLVTHTVTCALIPARNSYKTRPKLINAINLNRQLDEFGQGTDPRAPSSVTPVLLGHNLLPYVVEIVRIPISLASHLAPRWASVKPKKSPFCLVHSLDFERVEVLVGDSSIGQAVKVSHARVIFGVIPTLGTLWRSEGDEGSSRPHVDQEIKQIKLELLRAEDGRELPLVQVVNKHVEPCIHTVSKPLEIAQMGMQLSEHADVVV